MSRKIVQFAAATVGLICVPACTTLKVLQMPNTGPIEGIPYALPQKTLLISAQYELRDCTAVTIQDRDAAVLKVKATVNVLPINEIDPNERYYIPYASLHHGLKDTDLTIEHHENGTLKSVSLTQTDKTGETITAALGTIARLTTSSEVATTDEKGQPTIKLAPSSRVKEYCNADALNALTRARTLELAIAEAKKKENDKGENTDARTSTMAPMPKNAKRSLKRANPAARAASGAGSEPGPSSRAVDDMILELQRLMSSRLVYKELRYWTPRRPPSGTHTSFSKLVYPMEFLSRNLWLTKDGFDNVPKEDKDDAGRLKVFVTELNLNTALPVVAQAAEEALPVEGLVVRQPMRALMRLCEVKCPNAIDGDVRSVLKAEDVDVPQLGQRIVMPLRNVMFQTQTLSFTLSADGVIQKSGFTSNATAPAAIASLNSDLETIQKAKAAKEKAKADARQAALNEAKDKAAQVAADNQAVVDCLKAQKELASLGGTVTGICQ